jgi:predicted glutamine amidotransferase
MTSLFGCSCNQPQRLAEALTPVRDLLVSKAPVARWGLGYIQGGEVLLSRTPRTSSADIDFYNAIEPLISDYIIAHSSTKDGLTGTVNTQPFRFRRWLFAATDSALIDGFGRVLPRIHEHIPDFLRRNIKGKAPAESIFHVFLSFLHDAGNIDDSNLPTDATRLAIRATLALLSGAMTKAGASGKLGNLALSNGRSMLAVRLDDNEGLYLRRLKVPPTPKEPETFRGVLFVSASQNPGQGFEEVPPRSVVAISRDLSTDVVPLDA